MIIDAALINSKFDLIRKNHITDDQEFEYKEQQLNQTYASTDAYATFESYK